MQPTWLRPLLLALGVLLVIALVGFVVWWIVGRFQGGETETGMERVELVTTDGVKLVGDVYRPATPPRGGALLLHMMPATRGSWQAVGTELANRGWLVLAIDIRGHGESVMHDGKLIDFRSFSDAEHQASRADVAAALRYLTETEKIAKHQIGLVGASIGANLALDALAGDKQLLWAVLLSPGLDYHGLVTEPLVQKLQPPQRLMLVASDDDQYSAQTIDRLAQISPAPADVVKLSGAGHGTTMLTRQPDVQSRVLDWITSNATKISTS